MVYNFLHSWNHFSKLILSYWQAILLCQNAYLKLNVWEVLYEDVSSFIIWSQPWHKCLTYESLSPGLPRAFFGRCNATLANEIQHRATHLLTATRYIPVWPHTHNPPPASHEPRKQACSPHIFFKLNTSININLIKQVHVTFYCKSNKFFKCINKLQYSLYNSVWPWIHNTPSASISVCYHSRHEPKNIAKSVFTLGKFISLYLVFYYW